MTGKTSQLNPWNFEEPKWRVNAVLMTDELIID
jgi:hypothetical protein